MELTLRHLMVPSSWKWMLAMASYLILLHFFPASLVPGRSIVSSSALANVPLLIVYAAIFAVTVRFGWKSREPLMIEGAIVGILYFALYDATVQLTNALPVEWKFTSRLYALYLWPFVAGYTGSAIGMLLRLKSLHPDDAPSIG